MLGFSGSEIDEMLDAAEAPVEDWADPVWDGLNNDSVSINIGRRLTVALHVAVADVAEFEVLLGNHIMAGESRGETMIRILKAHHASQA